MNILRLAAQILLIYILYRLVVNFIIPTFRSVKKFRQQFRQMQQGMQDHYEKQQKQQQSQQAAFHTTKDKEPVTAKEGEYIEFEEVREK